jgi:hypothetical protein
MNPQNRRGIMTEPLDVLTYDFEAGDSALRNRAGNVIARIGACIGVFGFRKLWGGMHAQPLARPSQNHPPHSLASGPYDVLAYKTLDEAAFAGSSWRIAGPDGQDAAYVKCGRTTYLRRDGHKDVLICNGQSGWDWDVRDADETLIAYVQAEAGRSGPKRIAIQLFTTAVPAELIGIAMVLHLGHSE